MGVIGLIFALIVGSSAFARDTKIPFIIRQQAVKAVGQTDGEFLYAIKDPRTGQTMAVMQSEKVVHVPANEIGQVIKDVKNQVCNTIEDGEFKIWLKGEASGKVLGIGTSAESGIEVTVKCEKTGKKQ